MVLYVFAGTWSWGLYVYIDIYLLSTREEWDWTMDLMGDGMQARKSSGKTSTPPKVSGKDLWHNLGWGPSPRIPVANEGVYGFATKHVMSSCL